MGLITEYQHVDSVKSARYEDPTYENSLPYLPPREGEVELCRNFVPCAAGATGETLGRGPRSGRKADGGVEVWEDGTLGCFQEECGSIAKECSVENGAVGQTQKLLPLPCR